MRSTIIYFARIFLFSLLLMHEYAQCAEIRVDKLSIFLNGEIQKGDAERFANLLAQQRILLRVILDSKGGDVLESMKIGQLVNGSHIDAQVANGGLCVSACFFIFLEGYHRIAGIAKPDNRLPSQSERDTYMGIVGIHRPYLSSTNGDASSIQQQDFIIRKVRDYLASKYLAQRLIDEMMSRPSNDVYWLNENDLNNIGEFNPGIEEALISKCGFKRALVRVDEDWSMDKQVALGHCMTEYWKSQYAPQQASFFQKLKSDWRPWTTGKDSQQNSNTKASNGATDKLDAAHPKWRQIVISSEFTAWMKSQRPEVRALANSQSQDDAIMMIDLFKQR